MPTNRFDLSHPPFNLLTLSQSSALSSAADILFFTNDQEILAADSPVDSLYLVMKGLVREMAGDDIVGVYREDEAFDCRSLATGRAAHRFIAHEETLLCVFPGKDVLELTSKNPAFGAHFFATVSDKFGQLAQKQDGTEWQNLFTSKIIDAGVRPPVFLDGSASVAQAARLMKEMHRRSIFVRDGEKIGLFTTGDIRDIVAEGLSTETLVRNRAQFSLLSCDKDEYIFNALLLMTRRNIHRVVVTDKNELIGVLAQVDLLSFFSNHSLLIAQQLSMATRVEDLEQVMHDMEGLITKLATQGMKMQQLARLVQVLNTQMMARLWEMTAPPEVFANTALLALGSEGRGEQILKTDQDNALILSEDIDPAAVEQAARTFTQHMISLGYPPCAGGIMASEPLWRHTVAGWSKVLREWARQSQGEALMNLGIFLDAEVVCGPTAWLTSCRQALRAGLIDDTTWLSRMALPALHQFQSKKTDGGGGFWRQMLNREHNVTIDIKKAAIFPIVHGVRILSLEADIDATNTFERLEALVSREVLEKPFANDVAEALSFLMHLRLESGLRSIQENKEATNNVNTASLSNLDKDLLKDSLLVVKSFKQMISQHYQLDRF
jgi:CBS domain-containing protein